MNNQRQNENTFLQILDKPWFAWMEISLIVLFALWVGRKYLNVEPYVWPAGTGLGTKLLGHYFWTNFSKCGVCALWNGGINGGRPALADLFGSQMHPLVAITTLIWGVIGGAKIALTLQWRYRASRSGGWRESSNLVLFPASGLG